MDPRLFIANRSGRNAKQLILRCLEKIVGVGGSLVGMQTGDPEPACAAYLSTCALLEQLNHWVGCDGQWSLPLNGEAVLNEVIASVHGLQRYATGSDPNASEVRSTIESVAVALTDLPQFIRLERSRLAAIPRPSGDSGGPM